MTFFEYIKIIYPVIDKTDFEKIMKVIGALFDFLKTEAQKARDQYFITAESVKDHAIELGLFQFSNEPFDAFTERVYFAYIFYSRLGNRALVIAIIKTITGKPFEIQERQDHPFIVGMSRIGIDRIGTINAFFFIVKFLDYLTSDEETSIKRILAFMTPAHVKWALVQKGSE